MATQIVRIEANVSDRDFRLMRVHCRVSLCKAVTLQHVQHRCLAGIIEPEKDDVCTLLKESEPIEDPLEKVDDEHFFNFIDL